MSGGVVLIIVAGVVLVLGTVAALAWWALADVLFPGTARKTGQSILRRKRRGEPPADAVVVRMDDAGPAPAQEGPH
jgi:hypothetical protein